MIIEAIKGDKYIPAYNGNREDRKPITVHYRFLTVTERNKYFGWNPPVLTGGDITQVANNDREGAARVMIERIENFTFKVGAKKIEIDDAETLYETEGIPQELVMEIEGALTAKSAVIDTSPLESPSPSTSTAEDGESLSRDEET